MASAATVGGGLDTAIRPVANTQSTRKTDAQRWLDEVTASMVTGTHVDPKTARTTVEKWCELWLAG